MRHILPYLLAALLFLQSGVGALHCLRMATVDHAVICTPEGIGPAPASADPADIHFTGGSGFCAACHALPVIEPPEAPRLAGAVIWIARDDRPPPRSFAPLPPPRGPPAQPRAPPVLLA